MDVKVDEFERVQVRDINQAIKMIFEMHFAWESAKRNLPNIYGLVGMLFDPGYNYSDLPRTIPFLL